MTIPKISGHITLSFGWKGPSSAITGQGTQNVRMVDLIFKKINHTISVPIAKSLYPDKLLSSSFICEKKFGYVPLPEKLKIPLEHMATLKVQAGVFEGFYNSAPFSRKDREITLELPEAWEIGQNYRLVVTSAGLCFQAVLVKEQSFEIAVSDQQEMQFLQNVADVTAFLGPFLLPLMYKRVLQLQSWLMMTAAGSYITIHPNPHDQSLSRQALEQEISTIENETLKDLLIKAGSSKEEALKACLDILGKRGLENIMCSNLLALVPDPVPLEIRLLILEISSRFKYSCNRLMKGD